MDGPEQHREMTFPPDQALSSLDSRLGFLRGVLLVTLIAAVFDIVVFGFPDTAIPYNYPFFADIVLLISSSIILRRSYTGLQDVKQELMKLADYQLEDVSVGLERSLQPKRIEDEIERILELSFHPLTVGGGALVCGGIVIIVMGSLGVLKSYPYWVMNFLFGAAHGLFIGPALGGFVLGGVVIRGYIVDINLLDPDGVGGYRRIGDTLVRLVSYGVFLVTLDFIIFSSIAFTTAARFQQVIIFLYLLEIVILIIGTVVVTLSIRSKLLDIRDKKIERMQAEFSKLEYEYWRKHDDGLDNESEAMQLMVMTTMFNEIRRMNMWPVNLYSLVRLGGTFGFSLVVFLSETLGLLGGSLSFPVGF